MFNKTLYISICNELYSNIEINSINMYFIKQMSYLCEAYGIQTIFLLIRTKKYLINKQ